MIKILEAFGEPISYGGQESFVMNVLGHMDRTGMSFDLLSPYYCDNDRVRADVREYGGEVYTLGCPFRPGGLRNKAASPIRGFLKEHDYDVIHIHSGSSSMLAMYAKLSKEAGIKRIIVHSHCTGRNDLRHKVSKAITLHILSADPTDYCACSLEAGEWRFSKGICRERLQIIYNGIDAGKFSYDESVRYDARKRLGIDDDVFVIGCVGRLTWQKNQGYLLEILKDLMDAEEVKTGNRGACLLLAGSGEDMEMLKHKAKDLGVDGSVIFAGTTDDPSEYYQASDVLAIPSRYEGLGTVAIEGQAAGLDVIASDRLPRITSLTDGIKYIPLENRREWTESLASVHMRHPENADAVAGSAFNVRTAAETVRSLYLDGI